MSSLTIRIDEQINQQLETFAKTSQLTKSTIVRNSLIEYLNKQTQIHQQQNDLASKVIVSDLESVRARLALAESSNQLSDEVYEAEMKAFFKQELGIFR